MLKYNLQPRSREQQLRSVIRWAAPIAMGAIFLVAILMLQDSADRIVERIRTTSDPSAKERMPVVVTLDDLRYHLPDCPRIQGETREMTWRQAQENELRPCPYCCQEDWQEIERSKAR